MKRLIARSVLMFAAAAAAVTAAQTVQADEFAFELANSASADLPWLIAKFEDLSPGVVSITISNLDLPGSIGINQLDFNLRPDLNPADLSFAVEGTAGKFLLPSILTGQNSFNTGADGKYDLQFKFSTSGGDNHRFTACDSITYNICGIPGLQASDFEYLSLAPASAVTYYAAARTRKEPGLDPDCRWLTAATSSPIVVPEPSVLSLIGACALLLWVTQAAKKLEARRILIRSKSQPRKAR
ncbi:MAG TPA: hypothetical protein VHH88_14430, partial [Verrucomicrobiae bacterium]|nr:hypothetical protein [Verrucomicrobiae bacterium]